MERSQPLAHLERRRRTVVLAVFIYALGLFANALHLQQQRHAVCAHGEVIHVEAALPNAGADGDGPQALGTRLDSAEAHHHCAIATTATFAPSTAPCASVVVAAAPTSARRIEEPFVPRAPSFALYLLAPHHSPPLS